MLSLWAFVACSLPLPSPDSLLLLKNVSPWAFPSAREGYRNHVTARAATKTGVWLLILRWSTFCCAILCICEWRSNVCCLHLQNRGVSLLYLEDGVMNFLRNVDICTKLTVPHSSRPLFPRQWYIYIYIYEEVMVNKLAPMQAIKACGRVEIWVNTSVEFDGNEWLDSRSWPY